MCFDWTRQAFLGISSALQTYIALLELSWANWHLVPKLEATKQTMEHKKEENASPAKEVALEATEAHHVHVR